MIKKTDDEQIDEILEAVYNRGRIMEMDFNRSGKAPQWRSDEYAKQQLLALIEQREREARIKELRRIREFWGQAIDKSLSSKPFNFVALEDIDRRIETLQKGES